MLFRSKVLLNVICLLVGELILDLRNEIESLISEVSKAVVLRRFVRNFLGDSSFISKPWNVYLC